VGLSILIYQLRKGKNKTSIDIYYPIDENSFHSNSKQGKGTYALQNYPFG